MVTGPFGPPGLAAKVTLIVRSATSIVQERALIQPLFIMGILVPLLMDTLKPNPVRLTTGPNALLHFLLEAP